MTPVATAAGMELRDGLLVGGLRRSVNDASAVRGSIHDDATAARLGFRGGTVAGSIHLELFPPLLLRLFGPRWFERGSLSLYFVNATTDREAVRACAQSPSAGADDVQVAVHVEREDGLRVAEGTASVGDPDEPSALQARDLRRFEPGEARILAGVAAGDSLGEQAVRIGREEQARRRSVITEPLDWYWEKSPWGDPILTPATEVALLYREAVAALRGRIAPAVGLFGAIELRHVDGPLHVERPYRLSGQVIAVGQSPRTEYMWFDSAADDAEGRRIAEMRMLLRFMKASSSFWA